MSPTSWSDSKSVEFRHQIFLIAEETIDVIAIEVGRHTRCYIFLVRDVFGVEMRDFSGNGDWSHCWREIADNPPLEQFKLAKIVPIYKGKSENRPEPNSYSHSHIACLFKNHGNGHKRKIYEISL